MQELTVKIKDRTLTRYIDFERMGVALAAEQPYTLSSDRGPKRATIRADGNLEALQQLILYLRGGVEIYDGSSDAVFWGCLWAVKIHVGNITYGFTLDGMGNSINVVYILQTVNQQYSGSGTKAETGFGTDTDSIADYGTKQLRLRGDKASAAGALQLRATLLSQLKNPLGFGPDIGQGNGTYAEIEVRSWVETLDWQFYTNATGNAAGFEQNTVVTSEADQLLGVSAPAKTTIAFHDNSYAEIIKRNSLEDESSTFTLSSDSYVVVEGSPANSAVFQFTGSPQGGRVYTLGSTPTEEASGNSVTVKVVGQKVWQTFALETDNPFYAIAVDIRLKMYGAPTDNVLVKLYSVSGGLPNTLLATGTITNSEVPTYMAWVTAVLDSAVSLVFGTTYGILIERSSPTTDYKGFAVGVDTAKSYTRGALKLYANATHGYKDRPTDADLIFKVAGEVENTNQITTVEASTGEFISAVQIDDLSGLRSTPYQSGDETALQIIESKLKQGTSNSRRLLMKCDIDRRLIVYEEPTITAADTFLVGEDGICRNRNGDPLPQHKCPVAQWAKIAPLELLEGIPAAMKWRFIDEAQYNPKTGEWKVIRARNQFGPWDTTGIRE